MSWRDAFEPGSFRGATFVTRSHEYAGGRRLAVHEFPGRDDALPEDMGRRGRRFTVDCYLWGNDYRPDRDALLTALEAEGVGTLVHPWHGTRDVAVDNFTSSESTDEGGYVVFSVEFVEAGEDRQQRVTADTAAIADMQAFEVLRALPIDFARRYSLAGIPAFVEAAAGDLVRGIASVAQVTSAISAGAGPALRSFDTSLRVLAAPALLRSPDTLAHSIVGLISAIGNVGASPRQRLAALTTLAGFGASLPVIAPTTPARRRQAVNQDAIVHIVRAATAAELVRAVAATRFSSYDDAVSVRDALAVRLDDWAVDAADAGEDARAAIFNGLRRVMVRDATVRGGTLERTFAHPITATSPALVIVHRLHGPDRRDLLDSQVTDLVARNKVRHPGFVPGGSQLQVLGDG